MRKNRSQREIIEILKDRIGADWRQYMKTEVRKRRKERGLTQKRLAELVGCPQAQVWHLERLGYCYPKAWIGMLKELQIENIDSQ